MTTNDPQPKRNPRRKKRSYGVGSIYEVEVNGRWYWRAQTHITRIIESGPKAGQTEYKKITGTGPTEAIAKERMNRNLFRWMKAQEELPKGVRGQAKEVQEATVRSYIYEWKASPERAALRDEVLRGHMTRLELHVIPHIGDIPLYKLNADDLTRLFLDTLPKKVKVLKDGTKKQMLGEYAVLNVWKSLSIVLQDAVYNHRIEENPMVRVRNKPKITKDDDRFDNLPVDLPQRLLAHIEDTPDEARWLFAFLLGMRGAEVLGLTWDCIRNLDEKPLTKDDPEGTDIRSRPHVIVKQQLKRREIFHGTDCHRDPRTGKYACGQSQAWKCPTADLSKGRGYYIYPKTKSGKRRIIPLPALLVTVLREHRTRQSIWRSRETWEPVAGEKMDQLVFTHPNGRPIIHQQDNRAWHEMLRAAGVDDAQMTGGGHLARHVQITSLIAGGEPIELVGTIAGHSTKEITRSYAHVTSERMRQPLEELTRRMAARTRRQKTREAIEAELAQLDEWNAERVAQGKEPWKPDASTLDMYVKGELTLQGLHIPEEAELEADYLSANLFWTEALGEGHTLLMREAYRKAFREAEKAGKPREECEAEAVDAAKRVA